VVQWLPICAILAAGSDEQRRRYLPALADGSVRAAFSTTESQSGSDVSGIRTRARRDGNGFRLAGSKIWCTNAALSDFIIVAARTGEDERGTINFFVVEKGKPGFVVDRKEEKMGGRGVPSSALFFDDVFVPAENMLGEEDAASRR
jgi:alkylation response protein AidB-like acyl-CoA dehydrogenase